MRAHGNMCTCGCLCAFVCMCVCVCVCVCLRCVCVYDVCVGVFARERSHSRYIYFKCVYVFFLIGTSSQNTP